MALQQKNKQGFLKLNCTDVIEDDESDDMNHISDNEYNETNLTKTQETKHSDTYDRSNDRSNNINDSTNDEYFSSEEQNIENTIDILTEGIHKYNDDIEREEISKIVRAKQLTDIQSQRLLNAPHCDQLA
eukprot:497842_1